MAKSKGFFGLRTGSTKSMTFSVLRGQQITKDRVEGGANPKTFPQMVQRMIFANAVKFYKHAKAGLFVFGFEDKKPTESDYNAFMRVNAKNAVAVPYAEFQDDAYPAFGRYIMTEGSLPTPELAWDSVGSSVNLSCGPITGENTMQNVARLLIEKYPSLQLGDIVTIVLVHTSLKNDGSLVNERVNRYEIRQFVLDDNDTREANVVIGADVDEGQDYLSFTNMNGSYFASNMAKGCAVVFSRNTPAGLKVSTSAIVPNPVALAEIEKWSQENAIKAAATTWGATDPAILQGSLVD